MPSDLHGRIVLSRGPSRPGTPMLIGEGPGENEAIQGRPFVGRSGSDQRAYLRAAGLHTGDTGFYITNLNKRYADGNPDPTEADIAEWGPVLDGEIREVQPRYILAVGRFAARYLLDWPDLEMVMVEGLPFPLALRFGVDATVIPVTHPASGFYQDEARPRIAHGYRLAVEIMQGRRPGVRPTDQHPDAIYLDVSGMEMAGLLRAYPSDASIAIDTEGLLNSDWHWSIQVSLEPGTGYVLRSERPDFAIGIDAIRAHCLGPAQPVTVIHSAMHDFNVCRQMGLDLFECNLWDTRYAAYITRLDPQGLKPLAYRTCGMVMDSYEETIGDAARDKQLDFLFRILDTDWPDPEPRVEWSNDGTCKLYTPQHIHKRAHAILRDVAEDKRDKDGNPVDMTARWKKVDHTLRRLVYLHPDFGSFPIATLADVPLERAIRYAGRDPDATLRVYYHQQQHLTPQLKLLAADGNAVLPVFEEMQATGMLMDRDYCERKSAEMWDYMVRMQSRISTRYWQGKPFNPASGDQVAALMRRRGLEGAKKTKTGKVSTGKKSIEHLRFVDDGGDQAIADIIDWREHQKMRDSFYEPFIEIIGPDRDSARIHTDLNPYKVATRRISSSNPNLTAVPVRNELSAEVRDAAHAPDGYELGSWDLSQIEMRFMADRSRDPLLIKFFNDPRLDVHCETAARIFGLPVYRDADTKDEMYSAIDEKKHRYPSKRAGFGIITNIMGQGLLDQLRMFGCKGWDLRGTDDLIREWLKLYSGVNSFLESCRAEVRQNGVVYDCWGMPRYLPGVWSSDKQTAAEAERAASSHKIQGGAQGMLQRSMIWAKRYIRDLRMAGFDVRWVLQIHDEVILEYTRDLWDTINPLMVEALTEHSMKLLVPIKCSSSHHPNWGHLK